MKLYEPVPKGGVATPPVFVQSENHPLFIKTLSSACILFTKHVRDTVDNFKALVYFK